MGTARISATVGEARGTDTYRCDVVRKFGVLKQWSLWRLLRNV